MPKSTTVKAEAPAKARKAGPGLTGKPLTPSPELAAIVGAEPLARTAVVSKVWAYIREHGLQDPADRQAIVADDRLRAVFGRDRTTMFEMHGLLSPHLKTA